MLLLVVYFQVRGEQGADSTAGLEAFEQARAQVEASSTSETAVQPIVPAAFEPEVAEPADTGVAAAHEHRVTQMASVTHPAPAPSLANTALSEPDFTDWSEKRIAEYRESLTLASDLPLGVLSIDHLNIRVPVYDGASDINLNRGVARIRGTARIGEESNLGIAGHRDGFFRPLQDITVGDRINLDTLSGQVQYRVTGIQIVYPEDVHVLNPTDASTLTLVTCYPFYFVGSAPQRYIVTAEAEPHQVQS